MMQRLTLRRLVWRWLGNLLFLELFVRGIPPTLHACPIVCICASDLLSCVNQNLQQVPAMLPSTTSTLDLSHNNLSHLHNHWLATLPRLQVLRISHNQIDRLTARVFHNATHLQHLDLSSNLLVSIKEHFFERLVNLEELLLYNNRITQVDSRVFIHLGSIQKVYLSKNLIESFSFSYLDNLSNPQLRTLDLSSNYFLTLPIDEVTALPMYIKNGLYLHNNPLTCDCTLYNMFLHWNKRGLSSVLDFQEDHTCLYMGLARAVVKLLNHDNRLEKCSLTHGHLPEESLKVIVGSTLLITCNTTLPEEYTSYLWISPSYEFLTYPGNSNQSLKIHMNGSLEIRGIQPWDSGIYLCIAINRRLHQNTTHEVNVTVQFHKYEGEPFNTGLTTLLGCVVSLVLVLMYLYLTPCRCFCCCKKSPTPSPPHECSAQSSILSSTPPATEGPNRKTSSTKHVVFLEPIKEVQNGKIKMAACEEFHDAKNPKILQLKSDSDSVSSVFSDTPFMHT
ncbi:amphoterin-induced protein 3 [Ambystoma mexicanum]|uniref:amphoterin-induced protein 3 n=1 Tax=Ambystoma mexicanum TaxID=8296 RepID=UPI0037E96BA1